MYMVPADGRLRFRYWPERTNTVQTSLTESTLGIQEYWYMTAHPVYKDDNLLLDSTLQYEAQILLAKRIAAAW